MGIDDLLTSSLAAILLQKGNDVTGSSTVETHHIVQLQKRGAEITIGDFPFLPDGTKIVIFSHSTSPSHEELKQAQDLNIPIMETNEFLVEFSKKFRKVIAVYGSHGKTTITAMIAHILRFCGKRPTYLLDAMPIGMPNAELGSSDILVLTNKSNIKLNSNLGIINNFDPDLFYSEQDFREFSQGAEQLICNEDLNIFYSDHKNCKVIPVDQRIKTQMLGDHNDYNAVFAFEAAKYFDIEEEAALFALQNFLGLERRCTIKSKGDKHLIIEDFAHHPTELKTFLETLHQLYPEKNKTLIFQPHCLEVAERYSEMITELYDYCDQVYLTTPYKPDSESEKVVKKLSNSKSNYILPDYWESFADKIVAEEDTVYAIVGSKSIKNFIPVLTNRLLKRELNTLIPELDSFSGFMIDGESSFGNEDSLIVIPDSFEQVSEIVKFCTRNEIAIIPYSSKYEVLRDYKFNGIIIKFDEKLNSLVVIQNSVIASSGICLVEILDSLGINTSDVDEKITIGGAIKINYYFQKREICEYVTNVCGIVGDGSYKVINASDIEWSYNGSNLPIDLFITEVQMDFSKFSK